MSLIWSSCPGRHLDLRRPGEALVGLDAHVVLAREQRARDEGRDAEVGVVDRDARALGLGVDLDLAGLDARPEELVAALLHGADEVLDAALDEAEDARVDLARLDVVEVEAEQVLLAARADAAGDDAPHAQRHGGAAQAPEVVDADLRALIALDAEARAELFLARELDAAALGDARDDDLRDVVGELGVLRVRAEHEHGELLGGARGARRGGEEARAGEDGGEERSFASSHLPPQVLAGAAPPSGAGGPLSWGSAHVFDSHCLSATHGSPSLLSGRQNGVSGAPQ